MEACARLGVLRHDLESSLKVSPAITDVQKSARKRSPGLYDLTELKRTPTGVFGFCQGDPEYHAAPSHEQHKVLTYPRTDSPATLPDIVPNHQQRLKACTRALQEVHSLAF